MRRWIAFAAVALALAALTAFAIGRFPGGAVDPGGVSLLRPDHAPTVALGQAIYAQSCAACHGADLEGAPDWMTPNADGTMPAPPHDATGHTWHHPDRLLFDITKYGVARASGLEGHLSAMPAFEGLLSDDEIVAVLSFIKSTWPADLRQGHDALNRHQAVRQ